MPTWWARMAFCALAKLYRQMYAGTGISTDSARRKKSKAAARWMARQTKRIFKAKPMPELSYPAWTPRPKRLVQLLPEHAKPAAGTAEGLKG